MLTHVYSRQTFGWNGIQAALLADLRQTIEAHGDMVIASFTDDCGTIRKNDRQRRHAMLLDDECTWCHAFQPDFENAK